MIDCTVLRPGGVSIAVGDLGGDGQFRSRQSDYIAAAQHEPVEITSRGAGRRVVVVSPEFYDRAVGPWRTRLTSVLLLRCEVR